MQNWNRKSPIIVCTTHGSRLSIICSSFGKGVSHLQHPSMVVRAAADLNPLPASRAGVTQGIHESRSYTFTPYMHCRYTSTAWTRFLGDMRDYGPAFPMYPANGCQAEDLTTDFEFSNPRGSKKPSPEPQIVVSWGTTKLYRARHSSPRWLWYDVSTDVAMPETATFQHQDCLPSATIGTEQQRSNPCVASWRWSSTLAVSRSCCMLGFHAAHPKATVLDGNSLMHFLNAQSGSPASPQLSEDYDESI
jgi:hypothetical protein